MSAPEAKRQQLSAAWLTQAYLVRRLTAEQIAAASGWSSQYVRDRLREHGIGLRSTGAHSGLRNIDRDLLSGWLTRGLSVAVIADRSGYSTTGIRKLLKRWALNVPPTPQPVPPGPDDALVAELIRLYEQEQLSLSKVAARYGRSSAWVESRLRGAGWQIRPAGRRRVVDPGRLRGLLDAGRSVPEIAGELRCSEWAVLKVMGERGWAGPPRRPRGPTRSGPVAPSPAVLQRLYIKEQRSIADIAAAVGSTDSRILAALKTAGIPRRTRSETSHGAPIDPAALLAYVQQGHTTTQTAAAMGVSRYRVQTALRQQGLQLPPLGPPPAPLDATVLSYVYVTQHLDDAAIAARYQVPTWRITRQRRQMGIRRPPAAAPRPDRGVLPDPETLRRLYVDQQHTLAQIGRTYRTAAPKVRAALDAAGIPVRPRTSRASRTEFEPELLRQLYRDREWTTAQVAAHLNTTVAAVLRALHDHNIPVRRGGPTTTRQPEDTAIDPRLTALYQDAEVTALLRRYRIPRRHQPGTITDRFPHPYRPTAGFLDAAYTGIGLAASHIEQLTGHPADQILDDLHHHHIPVRPTSSFSPWYLRTYPPHNTPPPHSGKSAD